MTLCLTVHSGGAFNLTRKCVLHVLSMWWQKHQIEHSLKTTDSIRFEASPCYKLTPKGIYLITVFACV